MERQSKRVKLGDLDVGESGMLLGTIVERDEENNRVLVRLPGAGDVWMPMEGGFISAPSETQGFSYDEGNE